MNSFLITLCSLSVSGTLLSLFIMLIQPIIKDKVSKAFLYYVWILVLLRLVIPVGYNIVVPGVEQVLSVPNSPSSSPVSGNTNKPVNVEEFTYYQSENNIIHESNPNVDIDPYPYQNTSVDESIHSNQPVIFSLSNCLFFIWLLGAVIRFMWYLLSYRFFYKKIIKSCSPPNSEDYVIFEKMREGRNIRLACSREVETPMLMGMIHPVVVLPQHTYSKNNRSHQLQGILTHELTHYFRCDIGYKWAVLIVTCLHWFNPIVYLVSRNIENACELSCDEAVIRNMNTEERNIYGNILLSLAADRKNHSRIMTTTLCEGKKLLERRLIGIMNYKKTTFTMAVLMVALTMMLVGCASVFATVSDAESEPISTDGGNTTSISQQITPDRNTSNSQEQIISENEIELRNEPIDGKVCIMVTPSTIRDYQNYYFVPAGEEQETLENYLEGLDVQWEAFDKRWSGHKELGWEIIYKDTQFMAFEGGYFYASNAEDHTECLFQNEELMEYIQNCLIRNLSYDVVDLSKISNLVSATLTVSAPVAEGEVSSQTLTDPSILLMFEEWFTGAGYVFRGADCMNRCATLELTCSNGEIITMSIATDNCTIFNVNGVFYNYTPTEYRNNDSDSWSSDMLYKHFTEIVWADGFGLVE